MAAGIQNVPTKYWAASIILFWLGLLGWLMILSGLGLLLVSIYVMQDSYGSAPAGLFILPVSVGLVFGGLVALANVQLTRAAIDVADINREMLYLMRKNDR